LELSKMENDASGKFHNYCFEIDWVREISEEVWGSSSSFSGAE
jgi:hypothetical protein